MSKSTYMKWMTEAYLYEADDDKEKEHDKGDVWKSEKTGKWQAIGPSGDQESFGDDKEAAEKHANPEGDKGDKEEPKGKGLGKGDFERDGGEPEDKPFGGDTGKDADFEEPSDEPEGGGEDEKVQAANDKVADLKDSHKGSKAQLIDDLEKMKKSEVDDIQSTLEAEKERLLQKATGKEDWGGPKFDNQEDGEAYWAAESAGNDFYNMTHHYRDEVRYKPEDKEGGEQGRTGTEEIKVINGKKYYAIKESVDKRITVKEIKSWLKGLEEYRYRKIPGVDARRITSFINNGLNETDLPISLQKKWEHAKYSKEKGLADRFIKQRISQKLTQTESKHPIKEQYDRLFTDRVVL